MIILIAEAKTMAMNERTVTPAAFEAHRPAGEDEADLVMGRLASMEVADIAAVVKISYDLAAGLKRLAYEFPNKGLGMKSIEAFTGVVFRNLDYSGLDDATKGRCGNCVRILSSLYGYLRPDDIIKPYRLEYTTPLGPDDKPMYLTLKEAVTTQLLDEIRERGDTEVLDLLPGDAARCVDWKRVKAIATVAKVDFKDTSGERIRSPHAGKLKAFRGQLLRNILEHNLSTLEQVARLKNDDMMPAENQPQGSICFYV